MSWAAVAAAAVSVGGALLSKPKQAPAAAAVTPTNLVDEQSKAIAGNAQATPDIEALLKQANAFTQDQASALMEKAVPGYGAFSQNLLKAGADKLKDPYALPQDVTDNLNRISAERGISRGTAGQTNQYSALRDLGVNELDYGNANYQQAIQALTAVTGTAPRISPMSPMSFYVTPQLQAGITSQNNSNQQAVAQGANNANAAANNANNQNLWDSISKGAGLIIPKLFDQQPTNSKPSTGVTSAAAAVAGGQ